MPELDPNIRNKNWSEVTCGYTEEDAKKEALRCLGCRHKPCVAGCPVAVNIPDFIGAVAQGDFGGGYDIIKQTNGLPAICGRVCPQETQCEEKCVRAIKGESVAIGRLERFCADWATEHNHKEPIKRAAPNGIKIGVVGSGPAGLTCAGDLALKGYYVTVFEALHKAGGVLEYGIPEFRLPKAIVQSEINALRDLGVKIELNTIIGRTITVDELFEEGFRAVFIGSGAGLPSFMNIPGENSVGVYSANEYLTRINLMKAYRDDYATPIRDSRITSVVGGGNVAMDAARCAKRLGAETVYVIYRRSEEEMPARVEEIHHAKEEGIIFLLLTNPVEITADAAGAVISVTCIKMELGEPDSSGRRRPVEIAGSEFVLETDTVIIAVGTSPNPLIRTTTPGLETDKWGCLVTSDGVTTSREGVFAGGDAVTGAATVIMAMGAGKQAAEKIHEYITEKTK